MMLRLAACVLLLAMGAIAQAAPVEGWPSKILELSTHFEPGQAMPWRFEPATNISEANTTRTPGILSLRLAGKGQDVKGLLPGPIRIDQYPTPWFFQMGMLQDVDALAGMVNTTTHINYAFGLNVAVTFSDPKTWPAHQPGRAGEPAPRPPDTHDIQLLIVHLGSSGEVSEGLPQYTTDQHPETWVVWGRGDLGWSAMGDWHVPYIQIGNGMKDAGPASGQISFKFQVNSPTSMQIGLKFNPQMDFSLRTIDFAKQYGPATGIWEIGPIISGDRWIPDEFVRQFGVRRGPDAMLFGSRKEGLVQKSEWVFIPQPVPEPPQPNVDYLLDYAVFGSWAGSALEDFNDEFDRLGYLDPGRFQLYTSKVDTYTNPGYLTWTKMGGPLECLAWATPGEMYFKDFPPPWEIEACILPPNDRYNWDFDIGFGLYDSANQPLTHWYPGVYNLPVSKRRDVFDMWGGNAEQPQLPVRFADPDALRQALSGERIYMLTQFITNHSVRLGFKSRENDPWTFSEICDTSAILRGPIDKLIFIAWNAQSGHVKPGEFTGLPLYQQYRWDYLRYRYGQTQ